MRDRFTRPAQRALALACEAARSLGHNYVGTEHLLLALLKVANRGTVQALKALDITVARVRERVICTEGSYEAGADADRETVTKITDGGADLRPATLFRARVEGLVVHARCGVTAGERTTPQALRIGLDFLYEIEQGDEIGKTVDYGSIVEGVAGLLEGEEFLLLETGARMVGEHVLEGYTLVREVTVTVTKPRVPVDREGLEVSVETTFSR